jgi:alanine racemase
MGVVKADAYGHGVMEVTRTLLDNGVSRLAVSMLDEAIQLRRNGIDIPILILSYTDPVRAEDIINYNVTQTVFSHDLAEALSDAAVRLGHKVKVHIKIDTGMTRVGFMPGYNAVKNVVAISKLPGIIIEGLFTHFASADEKDKSYSYMQLERFMSICTELQRIGIHIPIKHVANSAAIIEFPEMHLDMVRPGIILYGYYPSSEVNKHKLLLKPAMTLKANVILVKEVENNTSVSYGRVFTTKRRSRIATIPIGYADGYSRLLTGKANVLINGELQWIDGIENEIRKLKESGFKLVIISSNSISNIERFFENKNLDVFDEIYSSKGIFDKHSSINKLIKKLGIKKDEAVYIGDEYRDIKACKKSKVRIISVTWGFDSEELLVKGNPDFIARTPQEMIDIIYRISGVNMSDM